MRGLQRLTLGSAIVAACLGPLLAGCRQLPRGAGSAHREPRDPAPRKLTDAKAADVQLDVGRALEARGDFEGAIASYRQAARRDPKRADAPLRLAVALDKLGRFPEAAVSYEAALKASPGNADVFCDRGYSFYLQDRFAEAEIQLRQALALRPDLARAHNNLGLLLGRTGRDDDALAEFRAAGLRDPDAQLNLSLALTLDRRFADARRHLAIAQKAGPANRAEIAELAATIDRSSNATAGAPAPAALSDPGLVRAGLPPLPAGTVR